MNKSITKKKRLQNLNASFTIFRRLPLLLSLTRRGFLFSLFVLVAQILLFFTGNIQNFLDENLKLILLVSCWSSIAMAFFSLAAIIECIYYIVSKRKMYFYLHLVIFFIFFIGALIICFATNSIDVLSKGLN